MPREVPGVAIGGRTLRESFLEGVAGSVGFGNQQLFSGSHTSLEGSGEHLLFGFGSAANLSFYSSTLFSDFSI